MIRSRNDLARMATGSLVSLALMGCAASSAMPPAASPTRAPSASPTGSTVPAEAITLRLATPEELNLPSQPFVDRFVATVAEASGGSMTIEPIFNAAGQGAGKEQIVAGRVISGDVDLAVVPVRAWSDLGVTSLEALGAPFLIDNDALLKAVTTDDALLQPLLDGMQEQGLVGLAVWPEDLRHPFTFEANGAPLVSPNDFKGQSIWAIKSKTQQEVIETLGATMFEADVLDAAVADGSLRGVESGLWAGAAGLPGPPTATADVTLYPKIQVIVVEDAVWSRLSPEQQAIVKSAATAARDLAIEDHRSDADLAKTFCAGGGEVVLAGPDNVAKFMDAAKPIYDRLEGDPLTATALDAIRALKAATPPSTPTAACRPPVSADATIPPVEAGPPLDMIPDGTYQQPMQTMAALLADGLNGTDARNNAGVWSMVVQGQSLTWTLRHPSGQVEVCSNDLSNKGDRIRWTPLASCAGPWLDVRWALDGDQLDLTFVDTETKKLYDKVAFDGILSGPWTKVE